MEKPQKSNGNMKLKKYLLGKKLRVDFKKKESTSRCWDIFSSWKIHVLHSELFNGFNGSDNS